MTRAEITDRGLARRLGQIVTMNHKGKRIQGPLVYYPDRYCVLTAEKEVVPLKAGSEVGLRRGRGLAKFDAAYLYYEYIGN